MVESSTRLTLISVLSAYHIDHAASNDDVAHEAASQPQLTDFDEVLPLRYDAKALTARPTWCSESNLDQRPTERLCIPVTMPAIS